MRTSRLPIGDDGVSASDVPLSIVIVSDGKERGNPIIVVSGAIGDEAAADCVKRGATDYLLKDRLARLGPAVVQALEHARFRDRRRGAEANLRESKERFRTASIGISLYPTHAEDVESLLKTADIAMYDAKKRTNGSHLYNTTEPDNGIADCGMLK